jgi:ribose transport system substrate-binding protein
MLIMSVVLISCSSSQDESEPLIIPQEGLDSQNEAENEQSDITIALVMKTLTNPFFVEMEKGARQAEDELGIHLLVKTGSQETSIEQQIGIIQNLIEEKVDAIVIAPADSTELIPILKEAQDAGIVIINIDNELNRAISEEVGLVGVPFISVDNVQGAYLSAKYMSEQITSPTKIAILEGIRTAQNAEDRKNGALKAFGENSNIEVVTMESANWKIDEAYDVTAKMFEEQSEIKAIFAANDMMALGALQYLEQSNISDVMVTAYDALAEAKKAIRQDKLLATIDQQAALQAYTGVHYAIRTLEGEELPPETIVDVKLITKENVDE